MARPSLIWRYGFFIIAVELWVVAALVIHARQVSLERRQDAVQLAAWTIVDALAPRYVERLDGVASLARAVYADAEALGVRLMVIAPDGAVLADSHAREGVRANVADLPELADARNTGRGGDIRFAGLFAQRAYHAARTLDGGAILRATAPMGMAPALWAPALRALGIGGAGVLLTSALVAMLASRVRTSVNALAGEIDSLATDDERAPSEDAPSTFAPIDRAAARAGKALQARIGALDARRLESEAILGAMADAVVALDDRQAIVSLNPAAERLLDLHGESMRGRLLQEAVLEPSLNAFVARAMVSRGEEAADLEFSQRRGAHVHVVARPLRMLPGSNRRGLLLVMTDLTRLRRLERIRSDFAANVSHELRTPITNIKGYVEMLMQSGPDAGEESREFLSIVHRNAVRLGAIIDDIMALTRIEQTKQTGGVERVRSHVIDVLRAACAEQERDAEAKGIMVEIDAAEALCAPLNADLIEQAVANLVANAVRYSPANTRVTVRARAGPGTLEIEVEDEGPGIAPEHVPRLFERFYRVDRARSRGAGGTGLGLAIVKHIAQAHGGDVGVQTEPGRGSTFTITLPIAGDDALGARAGGYHVGEADSAPPRG